MDFNTAYKAMVRASVERNTIEVPTLLSCTDFEGKECLEIGPGPLARLSIKLSGFARHITLLEKSEEEIKEAKSNIRMAGLAKKISIVGCRGYKEEQFPFKNGDFDVVYAAWLPHSVFTNNKFLDEATRVSRKDVLFLLPGINGDEPNLVSIVKPGEIERRRGYRDFMIQYLKDKGYKINIKDSVLRLNFKDAKEIRQVFYCMAFHGEDLGYKKEEVNRFLDRRTHNFSDGFYILHAFR